MTVLIRGGYQAIRVAFWAQNIRKASDS